MADDAGDKTEDPTPKRRTEAREQGNIARSPDLTAAAVLIALMMMLNSFGPNILKALTAVTERLLGHDSLADGRTDGLGTLVWSSVATVGTAMAPLMLGIMAVAVVVNMLQVGLYFNPSRVQPNMAGLNPFKGLGKLLNKEQTLPQFGMNLIKTTMVACVAYSAVSGRIEQILASQQLSYLQVWGLGGQIVYSIVVRVGVLLLVLAIVDYFWQRHRIEKSLKMSKQEVKDEMRNMDGDPKIKARRRQIAQQRIMQGIKKDVPTADVIVTNPEHISIALKYDSGTMHAPRVVAKGADHLAMKIREIARAHGIPIVERKPLARALYKMCNVGQEIPEQFYSTVAEILAYVYELSGKSRRTVASGR